MPTGYKEQIHTKCKQCKASWTIEVWDESKKKETEKRIKDFGYMCVKCKKKAYIKQDREREDEQ